MPLKPTHAYPAMLTLERLKADVRLGVGEEERATPQPVFIDVRLYLPNAPLAASDDNGKYICYHGIGQKIHALCTGREYRLIEYLAHEIHRLLRTLVPVEVKIEVKLHKPSIMLPYAEGGVTYRFTDLPAGEEE